MSTPIIEGAKVMSKGQITLPKDIREKLGVGPGDRLVLVWDDGQVAMMNACLRSRRCRPRCGERRRRLGSSLKTIWLATSATCARSLVLDEGLLRQ